MNEKQRIVIIGGGLSGLTLAYLLTKRNIDFIILEASSRLGGRIQTVTGTLRTPLELGATWFSDMHSNLLFLINELGLRKYPQFSKGLTLFQTKSFEPPQKFYIPEAEKPSYRLTGGTQMLIDTLEAKLPQDLIFLNCKIRSIKQTEEGMMLENDMGKEIEADKVILCIPPQLVSNIMFSPLLPEELTALLPNVQTWMAGSIKFTLEYDQPFWRSQGYSGMLYSHAGIITEMYDHTNFEEDRFGFTGFLNTGASAYMPKVRKGLVLQQLGELIGKKALTPTAYFDKVWSDEFILTGNLTIQRPHQDNGHPLLHHSYMKGNLYLAASETATQYPGYMEGAVIAARSVSEKLIEFIT